MERKRVDIYIFFKLQTYLLGILNVSLIEIYFFTDLKCPLYESELVYEAVDPILELANPDLEHERTSNAFEM